MQLAFDREYDVEVLLRLHEVPQVGSDDRGHLGVVVGVRAEGRLLLARDVVRLVFVLRVLDEVGDETLAQQTHIVLAHHLDAGICRFHYRSLI